MLTAFWKILTGYVLQKMKLLLSKVTCSMLHISAPHRGAPCWSGSSFSNDPLVVTEEELDIVLDTPTVEEMWEVLSTVRDVVTEKEVNSLMKEILDYTSRREREARTDIKYGNCYEIGGISNNNKVGLVNQSLSRFPSTEPGPHTNVPQSSPFKISSLPVTDDILPSSFHSDMIELNGFPWQQTSDSTCFLCIESSPRRSKFSILMAGKKSEPVTHQTLRLGEASDHLAEVEENRDHPSAMPAIQCSGDSAETADEKEHITPPPRKTAENGRCPHRYNSSKRTPRAIYSDYVTPILCRGCHRTIPIPPSPAQNIPGKSNIGLTNRATLSSESTKYDVSGCEGTLSKDSSETKTPKRHSYFAGTPGKGHCDLSATTSYIDSRKLKEMFRNSSKKEEDHLLTDTVNPKFEKQFKVFAKFGTRSTGVVISETNSARWFRAASLLDEVVAPHECSFFFRLLAGTGLVLTIQNYAVFLYNLARYKDIDLETLVSKLTQCEFPTPKKTKTPNSLNGQSPWR